MVPKWSHHTESVLSYNGIELRSSDLVASTFTQGANSPAPAMLFYRRNCFSCLEVSWAVAAFLSEPGEQGEEIMRFVKEEEKDEGGL